MVDQNANWEYIPGTCNIGAAEIAKRYRIGYLGLILTAVTILAIEVPDISRNWRLVIFFPMALALTGFFQAFQRFCLRYGFKGVFSVRGMRKLTAVTRTEDLRKDRKMAMILVLRVITGAGLSTIFYYLLPG